MQFETFARTSIDDFFDIEVLDQHGEPIPFGTMIYNNAFWNNDIDGVYVVDGSLVNNLAQDGDLLGNQLQCNLIGQDFADPLQHPNSAGIRHHPPENPNYEYNGFFQNPEGHALGCGNPNCVVDEDPLMTDNFHLYWHSPMINRGIPDVFFDVRQNTNIDFPENRDGSRNDIGPFGGLGAANFVNNDFDGPEPARWADMDPFCVIDDPHTTMHNGLLPNGLVSDRDFLEWDYYRVFSHITTPNGQEFDICNPIFAGDESRSCYFEFMDPPGESELKWTISGELRANGSEDGDQLIKFLPHPDAGRWYGFYIYYAPGDDESILFQGCEQEHCLYNIWGICSGTPNQIHQIHIKNCRLADAAQYNLWTINKIQNIIEDSEFDNSGKGIWLWNGSAHSFYNCSISGSNSNGMRIKGLIEITLAKTNVTENNGYGIWVDDGADPILRGEADIGGITQANNIVNNGPVIDHDVTGAEIRVSDPTTILEADRNNIWDVREGVRNGRIISFYDTPVQDDLLEHNYWGDNEVQNDDATIADDFYASLGQLTNDHIEPRADEANQPVIDNNEPYWNAIALMRSGLYEDASAIFEEIIRSEPGDFFARKALRKLYTCRDFTNRDISELREYYERIANTNARTHPDLAWTASRLAYQCLADEGRIDRALERIQALRELVPNRLDSLHIEMDAALMRWLADGAEINEFQSINEQLHQLSSEIDLVSQETSAEKSCLPASPSLTGSRNH